MIFMTFSNYVPVISYILKKKYQFTKKKMLIFNFINKKHKVT